MLLSLVLYQEAKRARSHWISDVFIAIIDHPQDDANSATKVILLDVEGKVCLDADILNIGGPLQAAKTLNVKELWNLCCFEATVFHEGCWTLTILRLKKFLWSICSNKENSKRVLHHHSELIEAALENKP